MKKKQAVKKAQESVLSRIRGDCIYIGLVLPMSEGLQVEEKEDGD